jgi:hypothetical protein
MAGHWELYWGMTTGNKKADHSDSSLVHWKVDSKVHQMGQKMVQQLAHCWAVWRDYLKAGA